LRFAYTKGGLLSKVWDMRGNYHRYVYRNQNHFAMLIEIHQANVDSDSSIRPKLQIIYDDNYRVIEQHTAHTLTVDSSGYLFDWNIPKTLVYNSPTGKGASFYWNENGQVYKIVPYNYPAGVEENFTYAASFGPQSVLTKTLKDANNQLFSFSYGDKNSPNHPSQFDLPDGRFFSYAYNPTHDLVSLKTPEGMNADWIRNQYGKTELINIKGKHIPSVIQTKMTYQPDGQLSQVSKDNVIKYKVESLTEDGQPLEVKHYVSATSYLTTKYMYDSAGRLVSSLDHRGTYTCFYYDNNDNLTNLVEGLTSACSLAPASASIRHTHYEFDAEPIGY
jgi:YD repeat-containing protein